MAIWPAPLTACVGFFFERHRALLQNNPRVGMMYRVWDRMDGKERKKVSTQANACLNDLIQL